MKHVVDKRLLSGSWLLERRLWHWQKRKHVRGLLCNTYSAALAALNCTKLLSDTPTETQRRARELRAWAGLLKT